MANIIKAFINIVNNYQVNITNVTQGNNRANNMGEGLETYIKKLFQIHSLNLIKKLRNKSFEIVFHMKVLKLEYLI